MSAIPRSRPTGAFVAGGLAMTAAVVVALILRIVTQQPTLQETLGTQLVRLIPGSLFEVGIQTFGPLAKKILFVVLTLGVIGVGGLVGIWLEKWRPRGTRKATNFAAFLVRAFALSLLVGAFLTTVLGGGDGLIAGIGSLLLLAVVYGIGISVIAWLAAAPFVRGTRPEVRAVWYPTSPEMSRRGLIVLGATAVTATVAAMVVGNSAAGESGATLAEAPSGSLATSAGPGASSATPSGSVAASSASPSTPSVISATAATPGANPTTATNVAPTTGAASASASTSGAAVAVATSASGQAASGTPSALTLPIPKGAAPNITSNDDFYKVSKNFFADPQVNAQTWSLRIDGLVEKPITLTLDQIKAMPAVAREHTLTCISNEVGGDLISNADWRGVRVSDLLKQVGVKPGVVKLALSAADGYTDSITLDKAMDPGTMLVYEMNGATLPSGHGYPLRMLVPNIYGMKNCKWITRIELVNNDFKGYWEQQGWSDPAPIETMSRIDVAKGGSANEPILVAGIAYAGERGIRAVQISDDGGKSWLDAQVKLPNTPNVWTLWVAQWTPKQKGSYNLFVRATDGTGQVQTKNQNDPFPDGATGWDSVQVNVS